MMVASSSIVNLEQSHHRYMNQDPTSPEMAFHMSCLSEGRDYDKHSAFQSPSGTFNPLTDPAFCTPATTVYKDALENASPSSDNIVFTPPPGTDPFYANSQHDDLRSPVEKKYSVPDMNQSLHMNNNSHPRSTHENSRLKPSDFSPPSKRMITESPPMGNGALNHLRTSQIDHAKLERYPSMETDQDVPGPAPIRSKGFQKSSNNPSQFYPKSTASSSPSGEDPLVSSPSNKRHSSQSSTHSNSSSTKPTTPSKTPSFAARSLKHSSNFFFDDDDDDSWKICAVCNDKATGYHFNALTCEGCKGFFRRSMKNSKTFTCPYSGNCTITKSNRRQCQACRLQKCLRIGMKKECIMSQDQIVVKKNLMLNNRMKRNIVEWKPQPITPEKRELIDIIFNAHCQTNSPPDISSEGVSSQLVEGNTCPSPASSHSSGFSDLINAMTQDIVATAPGQKGASKAHMRHFCSIMEYSIKEIIKFCKKIPTFTSVSLKDQITLLKSGCTEILFIKANYTYDRKKNALMCGPGKYYTRQSFILGGMSEEYTDCYLKFHHDLSHMHLDDTEIACLCAATLFSSDRDELENRSLVEKQQDDIVGALQSHSENTYHCRLRFPKIMAYLTRLRTLNWHISRTLKRLQDSPEGREDVTPLVLEISPTV